MVIKGAYRDDNGKPVVLECVREAERRIAGTANMWAIFCTLYFFVVKNKNSILLFCKTFYQPINIYSVLFRFTCSNKICVYDFFFLFFPYFSAWFNLKYHLYNSTNVFDSFLLSSIIVCFETSWPVGDIRFPFWGQN